MGSVRLDAGTQRFPWDHNFTESSVETVERLLRLSCRSVISRQGISLP